MERRGKSRGRRIVRRYEASRLEDQLWALAFEQVWPLHRKAVSQSRPLSPAESCALPPTSAPIARSA
jgi:hypothetical protein